MQIYSFIAVVDIISIKAMLAHMALFHSLFFMIKVRNGGYLNGTKIGMA
jgi:hypothetical protein